MRLIAGPFVVVSLAVTGCGGGTTTIIQQGPPSSTSFTTGAAATSNCGQITFSGTPTTIVVLRGTTCPQAVQVATAYVVSTRPTPWQCGLAHAPFDSYPLPDGGTGIIGFSCGYGQAGDLQAAPHAFIGVKPQSNGSTASAAGTGTSSPSSCPAFTGPGDNLVHSRNLQATNVPCDVAKTVVEQCRTDGTGCQVEGSTWVCSGQIPGHERCVSGAEVASIDWLD